MKKKLVSAENISDFLGAGASEIHVDNSMIMTAGAKDWLREKGIKIVYSNKTGAGVAAVANCKTGVAQDLKTVVTKIVSILRNDLQVNDAATVENVTQKVLLGLKRR